MIIFFTEDHIEEIENEIIRYPSNCLNRVLDIIARKMVNRKPNENGYTDIYGKEFEREYSNYQDYLDYLIRNKFIKRDYYIKGGKPFGYRFTENFKEVVEIKNFAGNPNKRTKMDEFDDISTQYIKPWVKDRIRKDFLSARVKFNPKKDQIQKKKDEWNRFIDIRKWLRNYVVLNRWMKKSLFFKWKRHRLYNNFDVLSSEVRSKYIKFNKEELVEFDISSSFPRMLAKYCIQVNPEIVKDTDFKEYCTSLLDKSFYGKLAQGLNTIRNCGNPGTLFKEITKKIKQGSEIIEEIIRVPNKDARKVTRDEAKLLFQVYLNGNYKKLAFLGSTPVEIRYFLNRKYPLVHNIIKDLKDRDIEVYDVLVELETRLIFQIIEELYSKFDDIRILTCHDAIYVPKSFESRVKEVWESNMKSFTSEFPIEKKVDEPIGEMGEFEEREPIEVGDVVKVVNNPIECDEFLCDDEDDDKFWNTPLKIY